MANSVASLQEQLQVAENTLEHLLEWTSRVDNKSLIVLGIVTCMLGVLASFAPPPHLWTLVIGIIAISSAAVLVVCLLFICLGSYPRIKGPRKSLIFFESIAQKSFEEYQEDFLKQSVEERLKDLLEQCHRNSEIIDRKFRNLIRAYRMLFIGVLLWVITLYAFNSIPLP